MTDADGIGWRDQYGGLMNWASHVENATGQRAAGFGTTGISAG